MTNDKVNLNDIKKLIADYLKSKNTPAHFTDSQQARQLGINVSQLTSLKKTLSIIS